MDGVRGFLCRDLRWIHQRRAALFDAEEFRAASGDIRFERARQLCVGWTAMCWLSRCLISPFAGAVSCQSDQSLHQALPLLTAPLCSILTVLFDGSSVSTLSAVRTLDARLRNSHNVFALCLWQFQLTLGGQAVTVLIVFDLRDGVLASEVACVLLARRLFVDCKQQQQIVQRLACDLSELWPLVLGHLSAQVGVLNTVLELMIDERAVIVMVHVIVT